MDTLHSVSLFSPSKHAHWIVSTFYTTFSLLLDMIGLAAGMIGLLLDMIGLLLDMIDLPADMIGLLLIMIGLAPDTIGPTVYS